MLDEAKERGVDATGDGDPDDDRPLLIDTNRGTVRVHRASVRGNHVNANRQAALAAVDESDWRATGTATATSTTCFLGVIGR